MKNGRMKQRMGKEPVRGAGLRFFAGVLRKRFYRCDKLLGACKV
jgi:hypothetical protein